MCAKDGYAVERLQARYLLITPGSAAQRSDFTICPDLDQS